jgi:polymorphic toxin system DSP-PTPase phosphatase-like protein
VIPRPLENSYWVTPGSLLAGEYPTGDAPALTRQRLQGLLQAGIDAFLDLTQIGERAEYCSLLPAHVSYLRSPIIDMQTPTDLGQMGVIQTHLRAMLADGRRVYVHCRAGIGRTGTVVGCYLTEQGLGGAEALLQLNLLWRQSARSVTWPQVPQTPEQAEFIQRWARHRVLGLPHLDLPPAGR